MLKTYNYIGSKSSTLDLAHIHLLKYLFEIWNGREFEMCDKIIWTFNVPYWFDLKQKTDGSIAQLSYPLCI